MEGTLEGGARPVNKETRPRLHPDDFLTYEELIERLPQPMTKEAIRTLRRYHGLPAHKIGVHTMFLGREVIEASARPRSEPKDIDGED